MPQICLTRKPANNAAPVWQIGREKEPYAVFRTSLPYIRQTFDFLYVPAMPAAILECLRHHEYTN